MKKIPTLFERVFDTYIVSVWMIWLCFLKTNILYTAAWFPKEISGFFYWRGDLWYGKPNLLCCAVPCKGAWQCTQHNKNNTDSKKSVVTCRNCGGTVRLYLFLADKENCFRWQQLGDSHRLSCWRLGCALACLFSEKLSKDRTYVNVIMSEISELCKISGTFWPPIT